MAQLAQQAQLEQLERPVQQVTQGQQEQQATQDRPAQQVQQALGLEVQKRSFGVLATSATGNVFVLLLQVDQMPVRRVSPIYLLTLITVLDQFRRTERL